MGLSKWVGYDWLGILQSASIAVALLLIALALFLEARARRVGNLIQLTQAHRELWERMYSQPDLSRILDPSADLAKEDVTPQEELFVIFLILHLSSTYYAMRSGFFQKPDGLRNDIERFFSLPIPSAVWAKVKALQDAPFVKFVERCLSSPDGSIET